MTSQFSKSVAVAALLIAGLGAPAFAEDSKDQNRFFPKQQTTSPVVVQPASSAEKPQSVFDQAFEASTERN